MVAIGLMVWSMATEIIFLQMVKATQESLKMIKWMVKEHYSTQIIR